MKLLVAADMEGISGVTNWDQVSPGHAEYSRFRQMMTEEVNAAIRGACEAGAQQVIVADGHASGNNLLIEALDPRARLNTGSPSPFSMVQGISSEIAGVFFIGYHARIGTKNAILDHTWSSSTVAGVWLNEIQVGEIGLNAAVCGHFGVPVVMISGDHSACAEALDLLGDVEVATVKQASGRNAALCLPPARAQEIICSAASRAVQKLGAGNAPPAFRLPTPIQLAIDFQQSEMAERAAMYLPGVQRSAGRRVSFESPDMPSAYRSFRAAVILARA